jgi:c-di-GMP-binding flagellar brake protein YcgR
LVGLMADRFTHKNYLHQAVVHDISEFGLAFGHTLDMPNGAPLELGLKLAAGDQFMDIGGKIVHVKPPQDHSSGYAHIYGVEFTDIQSSDQNEIVQWIFTHQREQIRRRRENS